MKLICGDALEVLKSMSDESVYCCVTSPPYWGLRDYETDGQLGLEPTPEEYVEKLTTIFHEVKRVLKNDGTLWLNLGDSYSGSGIGTAEQTLGQSKYKDFKSPNRVYKGLPRKNLVGIPWRVAFALQADGWYLRQDIIWAKVNHLPESVKDRCTKCHEYIFLLSKNDKYHFDYKAIREEAVSGTDLGILRSKKQSIINHPSITKRQKSGINSRTAGDGFKMKRSVWNIKTASFTGAHFATFPEDLVIPCIKAGCPEGETSLDPFMGSGTVGAVALKLGRDFVGIELNEEYYKIAQQRIGKITNII